MKIFGNLNKIAVWSVYFIYNTYTLRCGEWESRGGRTSKFTSLNQRHIYVFVSDWTAVEVLVLSYWLILVNKEIEIIIWSDHEFIMFILSKFLDLFSHVAILYKEGAGLPLTVEQISWSTFYINMSQLGLWISIQRPVNMLNTVKQKCVEYFKADQTTCTYMYNPNMNRKCKARIYISTVYVSWVAYHAFCFASSLYFPP